MIQRLTSHFIGDGLKPRAARGTLITAFGFGAEYILRLASNLILTRLLFPEAFGLMSLVNVIVTGLNLFSDLGIHSAIVRSPRGDDPAFLNTAWTMNILRGVLMGAVVWALAPALAAFYDEPMLGEVLPVVGIGLVVLGFVSTKTSMAARNLLLGRQMTLNLVAQVAGLVITALLAWWLRSVWALVWGLVAGNVIRTVLTHVAMPGHGNRIQIDRSAAVEQFHFGKWVFLSTIAAFFIGQADRAVLGKFVDLDMLALYSIAFMFAMLPSQLGNVLSQRVIYPLYAQRPPGASEGNRRRINRARLAITAILLSGTFVIGVMGVWLIRFLYDARYEDAGPIVVLIAAGALVPIVFKSYPNLLMAAGHMRRYALLNAGLAAAQTAVLLAAISEFGVLGAAIAPGVAAILVYPFLIWALEGTAGRDPRHDAGMTAFALMLGALALWLNAGAVAPHLAQLTGG